MTALLTGMAEASLLPRVVAGNTVDIITRIEIGTNWILGQAVEYQYSKYGFLAEAEETNRGKIYSEDNARVAWCLCNYHRDFTSERHDRWLKASVEFVLDSQSGTMDFHRYYDMKQRQWVSSGLFHYWNAHITALLAQTAFTMHKLPQRTIEYGFWDRVIQRVESCIDSWIEVSMRADGSWVFIYPEPSQTRTEDVGMMLNTLSCISGYEQRWGDSKRAERYSRLAQKTCEWILRQQEMDQYSWAYGGFYDDGSRTLQTVLSNARTMFGVLSYWTFIGLTVPQPDYDTLRKSMIAWVDGFVIPMMDGFGGPGEGRTETLVKPYPKRTLTAAELLRDFVLIWVDLGGSYYWSLAERSYHWLVGKNEMDLDMQQANNTAATRGGFYAGIVNGTHVDQRSTVEITAQCVEAMLHAMSIDIPEFAFQSRIVIAGAAVLTASLILHIGRRRRFQKFGLPA